MLTDDLDKRVAGKENLNGNNNMVKYTEFDSTQVTILLFPYLSQLKNVF